MEVMFDKMQIDYVGELTKLFPFKFSTTSFGVSIHKVHLHFIQDVMLPDDLTNANDEYPSVRARYDLADTILCAAADLVIDKILMNGLIKFQNKNFNHKENLKNFVRSLKLIESGANLEFNSLRLNVRFVTRSNTIGIFGIPENVHQFKETEFILNNDPVVLNISLERLKLKWTGVHEIAKHSKDVTSDPQYLATPSHELRL
ncbi:fermentation associated protein [Gigaspora margarita]|uniref:Fermentation associated protein n=1 Tax=Gigaspora margarita TaxID=4874 RepID=A0A8H4AK33_GIGMA|nr:fermentation associated protein [Gigaspora margarita]